MSRPRRHFALALLLFVAWVGALALMANVSGEPPRARASAPPPR